MLDLLSKIDFSFFLTLAISLLIGAGIFYYCYARLNVLEESVINQGKILQSFISGQVNLVPTSESNSTPNQNSSNDKIDVSDDEDESDNDNDDNDSDDDDDDTQDKKFLKKNLNSDSDSETDEDDDESVDNKNVNLNTSLNINENSVTNFSDVGVLDLGSSISMESANIAILGQILDIEKIQPSMEISLEKNENVKVVDLSQEENLQEVVETEEKKKKSINKMNVKELKELIIKKNLGTELEIKNLQKKDLFEILQNNNQQLIEE